MHPPAHVNSSSYSSPETSASASAAPGNRGTWDASITSATRLASARRLASIASPSLRSKAAVAGSSRNDHPKDSLDLGAQCRRTAGWSSGGGDSPRSSLSPCADPPKLPETQSWSGRSSAAAQQGGSRGDLPDRGHRSDEQIAGGDIPSQQRQVREIEIVCSCAQPLLEFLVPLRMRRPVRQADGLQEAQRPPPHRGYVAERPDKCLAPQVPRRMPIPNEVAVLDQLVRSHQPVDRAVGDAQHTAVVPAADRNARVALASPEGLNHPDELIFHGLARIDSR